MRAPEVPADKEKRALAKGEELGFTAREPGEQGEGRVLRRHQRLLLGLCMFRGQHPFWTDLSPTRTSLELRHIRKRSTNFCPKKADDWLGRRTISEALRKASLLG
jgi:hypothetical protein